MDGNVAQHETFEPQMAKMGTYVEDCLSGKELYDGERIVAFIDSFAKELSQHLADEIPTLLDLKKYGDKVNGVHKALGEDAQANMASS